MPTKRALILIAFCLSYSCLYAQSEINSSGTSIYSSTVEMSFSIGQWNHFSTSSLNTMTSGVLHVYQLTPLSILEENKITIWPNPVNNTLFLKIDPAPLEGLSYNLFDEYGRLWDIKPIQESTTIIDMFKYPSGSYILNILITNHPSITYKILKN